MSKNLKRAVFLDRDGVINRSVMRPGKPYPPQNVAECEILPGVVEALEILRDAGFELIVVTNQPDVARGTQTKEGVEAIHAHLEQQLGLDRFLVCYHDDVDRCACRKPLPGMLVEGSSKWGIDLKLSYMVGDRWKDIEAGRAAGCTTAYIDYGYDEKQPKCCDIRVDSLLGAAHRIIERSVMEAVKKLKVKIFADGADKAGMLKMYERPYVAGFTTNPTLMRKAGIVDYRAFAKEVVMAIPDKPISFEVFSDEFDEMEKQAMEIASWGGNVYVKIPVMNTRGEPTYPLIKKLSDAGVKLNVTAIMTLSQVKDIMAHMHVQTPCYISVFAGRIADTGRDPLPVMEASVKALKPFPKAELIWASPRQLLNIFDADRIGCHVITVTNSILDKLFQVEYDLHAFSLDTVKMFYKDAQEAGFSL